MKNQYRYYGWEASFFAGKVRGYLNYKGVDYSEKTITLFDALFKIPKHTGRRAMPALEAPDGQWYCDTPLIMEEMERRHPSPRVLADGPVQNFVAELFQNWVDDCWIPVAMHTRWSYPENYEKLNREEGGKNLLPFAPRFIRNAVADKAFLQNMSQHKSSMGIVPGQIELLEQWSTDLLDLFETHFASHPYLLGGRPTLADFALLGPMYGHLNRDPWPKREWIDRRPHLQRWIEKMGRGDAASSPLQANDGIPDTLMPVLQIIFNEFVPVMLETAQWIRTTVESKGLKSGDALVRATDKLNFKMGAGQYMRGSFTYSVWRMQRIQQQVAGFSATDQNHLRHWLAAQGQPDFLSLDFGPALKRHGLVAALL